MPFKSNEDLPAEIKRLPVKAQSLFRNTFNKVYDKYGEETSFKVAWDIVKKRFHKDESGKWIGKGMGMDIFTFEMKQSGTVFIQKGEDGEHYIEAILSDDMFDSDGKRFTKELLMDFEKQINEFGISGFITHSDWKKFIIENSHLPENIFIQKARNERKGILKTVKAIYDNGKLWIKALVDKRYLNRVKSFDKISIEAIAPKGSGNEYKQGHVLGFALDNNAINPRAIIAG